MTQIFGRINSDGNVTILDAETGEAVTRMDEWTDVYPLDSDVSAAYEHPEGIVVTIHDALRLEIAIEK